MLTALVLLCSIGTTDCRQLADAPDQSALPLTYGMEEAAKHPVPANNYVKVACVHKGVAPDYPVVAAWAGFLLFVGAVAFALGTAIHNEASAQQHASRPEQIYYCATDVEMPAFEPCKEMKGQRDIR